MYVRPQPQNYKYPREVRLPENYGGSTFREAVEEPVSAEQSAEQTEEIEEIQETVQSTPPAEIKETAVQAGSGFKLRLGWDSSHEVYRELAAELAARGAGWLIFEFRSPTRMAGQPYFFCSSSSLSMARFNW